MSIAIEDIPLHFAGLSKAARVPAWAKQWRTARTTVDELFRSPTATGVAVIQSASSEVLEGWFKKLTERGGEFAPNAASLHVVVELEDATRPAAALAADVARMLRQLPQPAGRVEVAWDEGGVRQSVIAAFAKLLAEQEEPETPRRDPLDEARAVIKATRPLLAPSGRLSATAVAKMFGLRMARLGQIIGSSRQALGKTPDAPAIQNSLRPFERIARLRAVLSDADFRAWLHRPNRLLNGTPPMDLIAAGRAGVVADLAEDMLLGTPG